MDPFERLPPTAPSDDVVDPKAREIDQARIAVDGSTVSVTFGHGTWERFNRVEWDENLTTVRITVYVGTARGVREMAAERKARGKELFFTLQALIRRVDVNLDGPVGSRTLIDGATGKELRLR